MNILTTNGLVGRYVTDWSGPRGRLAEVNIRLGAPNYPDCTMTMTGSVIGEGTAGRRRHDRDGEGGRPRRQRPGRPRDRHGDGGPAARQRRRGRGREADAAHVRRTVAIAGIGATEFSKASGRSELRLAVEAVDLALKDAGLAPAEVQGMVTFSSDTNPDIDIARSLGIGELSFFSRIHYGGGAACATVQQAALAVASGVADVVVCYRAFNERSGSRFGAGVQGRPPVPNAENAHMASYLPVGLLTPASWVAMAAQRYLLRDRGDERGPGSGGRGRPPARGDQPQGLVLRAADHARGAPGQPLDRRAAAPARLLPGDRRRPGPGGDVARAGPRPAPRCRWWCAPPPRARGRART